MILKIKNRRSFSRNLADLTLYFPMFPFDPPENIRKPKVLFKAYSDAFQVKKVKANCCNPKNRDVNNWDSKNGDPGCHYHKRRRCRYYIGTLEYNYQITQ